MTVDRLPLEQRPRFARKMVAVWRLHHLTNGEELTVTVWPGEWPAGMPHEVKDVPVVEDTRIGGNGAVMILGRKGDLWLAAFNLAAEVYADITPEDLAITTAYMQVGPDPTSDMKIWLHPSPDDGTVPMWAVPRKDRR